VLGCEWGSPSEYHGRPMSAFGSTWCVSGRADVNDIVSVPNPIERGCRSQAYPHGGEQSAMTDDQFRDAFNRVERHIEQRYGLPVVITDVPDPFTGDLDGATILVDYDLSAEDALFILVHLFGHTVQWNVSPADRALGLLDVHDPSDELLASLARYEQDAARYSLQLFHEADVRDLDQWLSNFAACDIAYLMHFYRTGEKRPFRSFWGDTAPALAPLAIPPFSPTKWIARSGTVI
jgi:hypothetical protein